jgi:hypothetical protein
LLLTAAHGSSRVGPSGFGHLVRGATLVDGTGAVRVMVCQPDAHKAWTVCVPC